MKKRVFIFFGLLAALNYYSQVSPTITISSPTLCSGNSVTLTASGASSYTWLPGNLMATTIVVSPIASTTYTLVGSANSSVNSVTAGVTVLPAFTMTASSSTSLVCPGNSASLSANTALYGYTWQPGNISSAVAVVSPTVSTIYTVCGSDANGCISSATISITCTNCTLPLPDCSIFYSMNSYSSSIYATNSAYTTTVYPNCLPPNADGIAIGPAFSFPAPNPTYWAVAGGTYWYYNGATFVNTGHSTGHPDATSPGGSKNFIYNVTTSGLVYKYNGITSVCIATVSIGLGNVGDIVGDDLDNFYYTACCAGSSIDILNSSGSILCTYSFMPHITHSFWGGGGIAIINNSVTILPENGSLVAGYISSPNNIINFSAITATTGFSDFASCPLLASSFSSSISASPNNTLTCFSPTAVLSTTSSPDSYGVSSYTWTGPYILSPVNAQTVIIGAPGVYTCQLLSCRGGTSVTTYTVYNSLSLPMTIYASATQLCPGGSATLIVSGADIYSWKPSLSLDHSFGSVVVANPSVTTNYTVIGIHNSCVDSAIVTISIIPEFSLNLSSSSASVCSGSSVALNASAAPVLSVNPVVLWQPGITFGNSTIIHPTATTIFSATATGSTFCPVTKTISIQVFALPSPSISASVNSICVGSSVTLMGAGAANYTWSPGNITGPNISVSPTISTRYTLSGSNSYGCLDTTSTWVNVSPNPTVLITAPRSSICEGDSVLLSASGAASYTWNPGNTMGPFISVSPTISTRYSLKGSNNYGCLDTTSTWVNVSPNPTVLVTALRSTICEGDSVLLSASGAASYSWSPSLSLSYISGASVIANPLLTSTYSVTGFSGTCMDVDFITLNVNPNPTITISSATANVCLGASTTLSVTGASSYTWLPSGDQNGVVVITPSTSTTYTVIGSSLNCSSSSHILITTSDCNTYHFLGLADFAASPVPFQSDYYKINFTIIAANVSPMDLSDVLLSTDLNSTFPSPCTYSVISAPYIRQTNSQLKTNSAFDGVLYTGMTLPSTSTLMAGGRDTLRYAVLLKPNGFYGPVKNSVSGTAKTPNNKTVSDSSNAGSNWDPDGDGDPTNNNTITIIDIEPISLFIPEGFSPNDDGKNDLFIIHGLNGRSAKLLVYNRWGNNVYERSGTDLSWDGRVNTGGITLGSDKLPPATYYYTLEFLDGDKRTVTGFVVLEY